MLDRSLAAIRSGESRTLVVRGEAGVGKSALLEYLVGSASEMQIVRATGIESEMELAFAGLHQGCAPLLDALERLPAPQREALEIVFGLSSGPVPDLFLIGLAVLSLLSDACDNEPLLCVIDDAQWIDQASTRTLAFVARRLLAEPVGIVFAAREPGEELAGMPDLEVRELPEEEARALLNSVLHVRLDERVRERIIAETRGNPLALIELPRGLTTTELAEGFGLSVTQPLPGRIEESFLRRVEELSDEARQLLLLAAAEPVGDPMVLVGASEQLGVSISDVREETDGFLQIADRVAFRHPLVRSAVHRSATAQQHRLAHTALAASIDPVDDPDRHAWHRAAAAADADEEIAGELERSATRARARGGLAAAAAFLQRSAGLSVDRTRRVDRALAGAEASLEAGDFVSARNLLTTAQADATGRLSRARIELVDGHIAFLSTYGGGAKLLLRAARSLEGLDRMLARDAYLDAMAAAFVAGTVEGEGGLLDVARAARTVRRADGGAEPPDLLLDSLATLFTEGLAAAAPLLKKATRSFANSEFDPSTSLRWGWMSVLPPYALWDDASIHAINAKQLEGVREAGAIPQLILELSTMDLLAARCGEFAKAEEAIAESEALSSASGRLTSVGTLRLRTFQGHQREARTLVEDVTRDAVALGQGIQAQAAQWGLALLCKRMSRLSWIFLTAVPV